MLQNGYISAALGLPSTEKGGKKGEKKKTMAASGGKDSAVAGKIELLGTPRYAQFGDVVHRIPGMTYLALHVISAKGLLSRSEDGHDANPFVTATWDQVSQQTRVVRRSTAPQFGETIYFPLRLLTLHGEEGKKALEKKGGAAATPPTHPSHASNAAHLPRPASPPPTSTATGELTLYVLDYPSGSDTLGFLRIGLDQITDALTRKLRDVKTRVFESEALPLTQPGTRSKIGTPCRRVAPPPPPQHQHLLLLHHLHHLHHLLPVTGVPRPSPGGDQARGAQARRHTARRQVRRARKGVARGGAAAALGARPLHALRDGRDQHDPLPPTYLQVQPAPRHRGPDDGRADGEPRGGSTRERWRLPRSPSSPPAHSPLLATQVNCITFENDQHTVEPGQKAQKGGAQELWSNPNYFMEVKKGASEDHAILLANLFLGMGLDAYLAIGRLPGGVTQVRRAATATTTTATATPATPPTSTAPAPRPPPPTQHVWVLTREPNGDVLMWETTKGKYYTLPQRWSGLSSTASTTAR